MRRRGIRVMRTRNLNIGQEKGGLEEADGSKGERHCGRLSGFVTLEGGLDLIPTSRREINSESERGLYVLGDARPQA